MKYKKYKALVSSDWNQCLAPCGPFDPFIYCYPDLSEDLTAIFKEYTGNIISLGNASERICNILPAPLTIAQMDDYLDSSFRTYKGVPELMSWCEQNNILFMINTTGMIGYFQRIFAKNLLPTIPVISANALLRYPETTIDPPNFYALTEVEDKGQNTGRALHDFSIPEKKTVIIGDSGGDGPHFKWAKEHGAFTIGSMAKLSLIQYCQKNNIRINLLFGPAQSAKTEHIQADEMAIDFMELRSVLMEIL